MTKPKEAPTDESAIDDVRRIREQFSRESGGDIRKHVEQTQAEFEKLQSDLHLRTVTSPNTAAT